MDILKLKAMKSIEYFKLIENRRRLIEKIKSKYLITLNEDERYIIVDKKDSNKLKEFLKDCWLLHGIVTLYLTQKWKSIQIPTEEEKIWYEHLWGKQRTTHMFTYFNNERVKFNKNKNQKYKQNKEYIQKLLGSLIIALTNKFESIQTTYSDIIDDYSYLVNPLLNLVYPQFFRN